MRYKIIKQKEGHADVFWIIDTDGNNKMARCYNHHNAELIQGALNERWIRITGASK